MTNDTTPAAIGADALIDELEYAILGIPIARNFDRVRAAKAALRAALASAAQPAYVDADRAMRAQAAPQQEAQEPVAFIHWPFNGPPRLVWYSQQALNNAILKTHEDGYKPDVKLYTAPQPAPVAQGDAAQPRLTVRLTSFHESNGKRNWAAMLVRAEKFAGLLGNVGGITIADGELWNRVAYAAECARFLIGERDTEPCIFDYGNDIQTPDEWQGETRRAARAQAKEGGEA